MPGSILWYQKDALNIIDSKVCMHKIKDCQPSNFFFIKRDVSCQNNNQTRDIQPSATKWFTSPWKENTLFLETILNFLRITPKINLLFHIEFKSMSQENI